MNVYFAYLVLDNALAEDFPYLINGNTEQYVTDNINISLYGYCTNKEDMQKFMECRNKDIFYVKRKRVKRSEYKKLKGLRKESLRDNMTVAKRGGQVANDARKSYEKQTKKSAISKNNALNYKYIDDEK